MLGSSGSSKPHSQKTWSNHFSLLNQPSTISSYLSMVGIPLASAACCSAYFLPGAVYPCFETFSVNSLIDNLHFPPPLVLSYLFFSQSCVDIQMGPSLLLGNAYFGHQFPSMWKETCLNSRKCFWLFNLTLFAAFLHSISSYFPLLTQCFSSYHAHRNDQMKTWSHKCHHVRLLFEHSNMVIKLAQHPLVCPLPLICFSIFKNLDEWCRNEGFLFLALSCGSCCINIWVTLALMDFVHSFSFSSVRCNPKPNSQLWNALIMTPALSPVGTTAVSPFSPFQDLPVRMNYLKRCVHCVQHRRLDTLLVASLHLAYHRREYASTT